MLKIADFKHKHLKQNINKFVDKLYNIIRRADNMRKRFPFPFLTKVYEQILETIEEYCLLLKADRRMKNAKQEDFIP